MSQTLITRSSSPTCLQNSKLAISTTYSMGACLSSQPKSYRVPQAIDGIEKDKSIHQAGPKTTREASMYT